MVWDLETMERNNREAAYNYVERNRDVIDSAVSQVLNVVLQQVHLALKTINIETEKSLKKIEENVEEKLQTTFVENLGMKDSDAH